MFDTSGGESEHAEKSGQMNERNDERKGVPRGRSTDKRRALYEQLRDGSSVVRGRELSRNPGYLSVACGTRDAGPGRDLHAPGSNVREMGKARQGTWPRAASGSRVTCWPNVRLPSASSKASMV